ncbi:MAG TPA: hypothetical protein VFN48_00775 [Solirubrobacteraceae bacterium]|nr:hypothetical protein [Solirubrobacteraceae bacterium]
MISTDQPAVEMELPGLSSSRGLVSTWRTRQNAGHSISDAGARRRTVAALHDFDPVQVAALEAGAWAAYYRHEWWRFIRLGMACARQSFGLPWRDTVRLSWLVMRANQHWSPYPDNDAARALATMERFYAILADRHGLLLDPAQAARRDLAWWRIHRELQHGLRSDTAALEAALIAFWQIVYPVPEVDLSAAARDRAVAMEVSDRWIVEGCHPDSPLLERIRRALTDSYAALHAAVAGTPVLAQ